MFIRKSFEEFSGKKELVLNQFCDSGVAGGEYLKLSRKLSRNFVGYDINPLTILFVKFGTSMQNIEELEKNLERNS